MKHLATKLSLISIIFLLFNACTDLGPIRDYAKASQDLTSGQEIVNRWKNSDVELTKPQPLFDGPINTRRDEESQKHAEEAAKNLIKIHNVLGQYFSAVALLADDGLPSVKTQSDSLSNSIKLVDSNFNEADQAAFKAILNLLSIPLDAYRQKAVIKLIKEQDENVEKLLTILEQSSLVIESDIRSEADASTQPYYSMLGDIKDKGVRYLIREKMFINKKTSYQPLFAAIANYRSAIANIKYQHKKIATSASSSKDNLKQTLAELKDAKKQIESAKVAVETAISN